MFRRATKSLILRLASPARRPGYWQPQQPVQLFAYLGATVDNFKNDTYRGMNLTASVGLLAVLTGWFSSTLSKKCESESRVEEGQSSSGSPEKDAKGEGFHLVNLETRQRTFFKYEKRIRTLSTPEKVFEYFSSVEEDGVKSMTHQDLLKALTAVYPPEGSTSERAGALMGERAPSQHAKAFFSLFDTDDDNQISYSEFILLMTIMSIPIQDAKLIFEIVDLDNNGFVEYDEFMTVITQIQNQTPQTKKNLGGLRTGLQVGDTTKPVGILAKFFGEDGSKKLELSEFKGFLNDIHHRFVLMEFCHYDYKNTGKIRGIDFARSMCCGADVKRVDIYLDKVATMEGRLANHLFSMEEFVAFFSLLGSFHALSTAIRFVNSTRGSVGRKEFQSIVHKVSGAQLSDEATDLVFFLFSIDDNKLNCGAFLDTYQKHRNTHVLVQDFSGSGMKKSFVRCLHGCLA